MVRVHWTVDLPEAHIVAGLLLADDVPAFVFDDGMVRQDWFKALAIGGYRVVVAPDDVPRARPIVARYLEAYATRAYSHDEMPRCVACGTHAVADDPRPRRAVFAALLAGNSLALGVLAFVGNTLDARAFSLVLAALLGLTAAFYFPGVLAFVVKHRYACADCGRRFRDDSGASFAELAAAATAADGASR
jgi:hypothetical protein